MTYKPVFADMTIPAVGSSLTDGIKASLTPKFDKDGNPETVTLCGLFEYVDRNKGWGDTFRVVDTDGMPFALDALRAFMDRGVKITIEYDAEEDARREVNVRNPLTKQE